MKKIFKFIPVALAAVALASCSSDDLTGNNGEFELKPNQMLVTVEELDVTRAGFVEKQIANDANELKLKRATVFQKDDVLKIYDDKKDWRPQMWTYKGAADVQYTNATGAASGDEGETAIFEAPATVPNKYDSGYGIYPAVYPASSTNRFGEFTDEARLKMKFDFNLLKKIDVNAGRNMDKLATTSAYHYTEDSPSAACYGPVPMWGVAANQKMTLKYLTGFLRIDITNVTPAQGKDASNNPTDAKWLLIRSDKALTGEFTATIADPDDATDGLTAQAPVLVAPAATASSDALDAYPKTGSATGNTDILVNIGQCGGDLVIYVPISAGKDASTKINHNFQVLMSDDVLNTATTIDFTAGTEIANSWTTPVAKSVYRGQTYNIIDDSRNVDNAAHTPYDMTKAIVDADKRAMRDFTISFGNEIKVKNDDSSTQNYYLDLTFTKYGETGYNTPYVLKHNVTVNVNLVKDASATAKRRLFIKTPANGKKLTLNFGAMTEIDQIVILDDELNSELVLKRQAVEQLPRISIGKNNADLVTIKSGSKGIYSNSNFKISTDNNALDNIDQLTLANGLTKVTIEKGRISTVDFAETDKIADDVEIYTTGQVGINKVDYTNVPRTKNGTKYTDTYNVKYNSVWDGSKTTIFPVTQLVSEGATINNAVVTASQLAAMTTTDVDFTVAGTFDLSGSTQTWAPLAGLTWNVSGAKFFRCSDAAAAAITGKAVIKNLKGANGLLASWVPGTAGKAISNFKFEGENKVTAAGNNQTALLVGQVTPGAAATINDIEFDGTSNVIDNASGIVLTKGTGLLAGYVNTSAGALTVKNIAVKKGTIGLQNAGATAALAAVIGKFEASGAALTLANVKVAAGVTVNGFKHIGGIIGEITSGKVNFAAMNANGTILSASGDAYVNTDALNESAATLTTYRINGAPYSQMLPTYGQFFGTALATGDGDITIMGDITVLDPFTSSVANTNWGYYLADKNGEYFGWNIFRKYNEIGHCGYTTGIDGEGNNIVKVNPTFGFIKNIRVNTNKYEIVKKLYPAVSTTAPVDDANIPNYDARYTGYVKKNY